MTVNSANIGADWFLNGLANLQNREIKTQKELSSGYAVSSAADNPSATRALVDLGSSLASAQAYQTNLGNVQAEASAADGALSSAINLVQSAQSLATQGATSTATASQRQALASQVQSIQQQIVSIANTQVGGRFIFGGDQDQTAPYKYDAASATGVGALTASPSTRTIVNPAGQTVYQSLTAGQIFDPSNADGTPAASNTFAALENLQTALQNNDTAGIASALSSFDSVSTYLNQQQVHYGTSEQRLSGEQNSVTTQITTIQTSISAIRDANIAQDATDLTQESTSQQAATAAQAAIPQKSLFSYIA
jgi:flagellar hook-associated protein 3 FlgL